MFSESRAPAPGEQRGFKPHAPHFIPWLRNSLKPHHSSDLGLNGPYKSSSEARHNLAPLEKAKGIGLFSSQGKNRVKKELRFNGVGMARILPVVLRGHHILPGSLGKQREESPARWNQSPELDPEPGTQVTAGEGPQDQSNSSTSAQDDHSSPPELLQSDGTGTLLRKYGPLVGPPPSAAQTEPNCKVSVVVGVEDRSGKLWDGASQKGLRSSSWLSSDNQELTERQHAFTSSFSYIKQKSRNSQSQRDLTALREPPVEGLGEPLNGVLFSTEVPLRGPGCSTSLRGARKHRLSLDHTGILGHNQTWNQYRLTSERELLRKEASCSRKVVRNQIKRVVDNLEQVLRALRDVHQEMSEVVQQIDFLTSSIDLNEEGQQQRGRTGGEGARPYDDSGSSPSSSEVTVRRSNQRPSDSEDKPGDVDSSATLRINHRSRNRSPPTVLLTTVTSGFLTDRKRNLRFASSLGSSTAQDGPPQLSPPLQNLVSNDLTPSPQRDLPVRPPTPGLSPLTVNLHHASSPGSPPRSPAPSSSTIKVSPSSPVFPKPPPPPTLCPSVIIENKIKSYQTPQSDPPSADQPCPSVTQPPSACCPPTSSAAQTAPSHDREPPASFAGPVNKLSKAGLAAAAAAKTKPPTSQDRRGRKPPPYPHQGASELIKKAKEPRKAPPYPEKRRLLSTTV